MAGPWLIFTLGEATLSAETLPQAKSVADRGRRRATQIEHQVTGERWTRNELRGGWRCTRAAKYAEAEDPAPPPWWVLYAAAIVLFIGSGCVACAAERRPSVCDRDPWICQSPPCPVYDPATKLTRTCSGLQVYDCRDNPLCRPPWPWSGER